jgi:hypothetical protein
MLPRWRGAASPNLKTSPSHAGRAIRASAMGKLRWYKRDPDAALGGMMGLTLEERGAYNTVLDLIYSHDDRLVDDDRFIAGWCQCDVRVYRRIKDKLIEAKKLVTSDGFLRNFRATSEVFHGLQKINQTIEAGRIGGRNSSAAHRHINGLGEATATAGAQAKSQRPFNTSTSTTTSTQESSLPGKKPESEGEALVRVYGECLKNYGAADLRTQEAKAEMNNYRPPETPA